MSTPIERVREYIRQADLATRPPVEVIHGIFTDKDAEMADLTLADLKEVMQQLAAVRAVADDLQTRGDAIQEKGNNGSIYAQERVGRGLGYREAARSIYKALGEG